jgi:LacI family transcriptional regulator
LGAIMTASPTLEDVARRAMVSTATVSRCLNDPKKVQEKTRARVLAAVEELGYAPHFGAKAMASRRTYTIGAVVPTMENAIFARGLQAFQEVLYSLGYHLLVSSSSYSPKIEAAQVRALVARGADGLLLIGQDRDADTIDFLTARNLPVVAAWTHEAAGNVPSVGFDNRASMRLMAEHVIGLGHRRIAVLTAPVAGNDRARARLFGVRDACLDAGIDESDLQVVETEYAIESGARAFRGLMQSDRPATAVICGNDVLAAGAIVAARDMGLRVPDDISVTGFDDIELASVVTPALTTVHVPHKDMGQAAAHRLINAVEGRDGPTATPLDTHLVLRGSLSGPRQRTCSSQD